MTETYIIFSGVWGAMSMEAYKKEFIDFLLEKGVVKIGEFTLKSGRKSPYFINTGLFSDGESIEKLGYSYAAKIMARFKNDTIDTVFGPAYKGIPLSVATTISLYRDFDISTGYTFDRKEPKNHGEATKRERQKSWLVGHVVEDGMGILLLDDVMTTGKSKYDAIALLNSVADDLRYIGLVIAVDREEVGKDGKNAIKEFEEKTGIPVESIVTIREIIAYLEDTKKIPENDIRRLKEYLTTYGTAEAKRRIP
jgi:orotate phosphoribosyltransferase